MVSVGLIGLGKMGLSHCAILNAHADVNLSGVCDTSKLLRWGLGKYSNIPISDDYKKMINSGQFDGVVIATPTSSHFSIAEFCLQRGIHVFLEKPCCLNYRDTSTLREIAAKRHLLIQVGYHNRFLGTFREVRRMVEAGDLGEIYHFCAEAYGPVVVKEQASTWRSNRKEGGGCLYDYASHVINLTSFLLGDVERVSGTQLKSIFSDGVEDSVYSTLKLQNGISGQLAVNWSDESHRKMSTKISIFGKKGKIEANAQELKHYRNKGSHSAADAGWALSYLTDHTDPVDFYLRGEEYSAQIDSFIKDVAAGTTESVNSIQSAGETDRVIELLIENNEREQAHG